MDTPSVNPMLHSVWALTQFDEGIRRLRPRTKRLRFGSGSQLGDMEYHRMPNLPDGRASVPIELRHWLSEQYTIRDGELHKDFLEIHRLFIEPCIQRLVRKFAENMGSLVIFGRVPHVPANFGCQDFRADYNNISMRCVMQYDVMKGGVTTTLDTLFGSYTPQEDFSPERRGSHQGFDR